MTHQDKPWSDLTRNIFVSVHRPEFAGEGFFISIELVIFPKPFTSEIFDPVNFKKFNLNNRAVRIIGHGIWIWCTNILIHCNESNGKSSYSHKKRTKKYITKRPRERDRLRKIVLCNISHYPLLKGMRIQIRNTHR